MACDNITTLQLVPVHLNQMVIQLFNVMQLQMCILHSETRSWLPSRTSVTCYRTCILRGCSSKYASPWRVLWNRTAIQPLHYSSPDIASAWSLTPCIKQNVCGMIATDPCLHWMLVVINTCQHRQTAVYGLPVHAVLHPVIATVLTCRPPLLHKLHAMAKCTLCSATASALLLHPP